MATFLKDPEATVDFSVDWSAWLQTDELIASSSWAVASGDEEDEDPVTIGSGDYASTSSDTAATVWLLGGTDGTNYRVTNTITTDSTPPRVDERSIYVSVQHR
jgi:hypothetical protein